MEVIYGLLPLMLATGVAMVGALFWAVKSGQFEDLEGPANRIVMDDDDPRLPSDVKEPSPTPPSPSSPSSRTKPE